MAGFGFGDDDRNDDQDGSDIGSWMQQRQQQVDNADADYAAGQAANQASIRDGQYLAAATPDAVRVLGAQQRAAGAAPSPIRRGDKAILADKDYAGILFNETRSFSGPDVQTAREHLAHTLINDDETWGPKRIRYAKSAVTVAKPPPAELAAYQAAVDAVAAARAQRAKGIDPTNGALHFRFTTTPTTEPFGGRALTRQFKVHNSYTKGDTPSDPAYVNIY